MTTKKILIVEDDDHVADLLKTTLTTALSVEATVCASGDEAMMLVAGGYAPDLVLQDFKLIGSDISGEELCVILRNSFPKLPIVVLSGYSNAQEISDMLRACATTFINKPYSPMDLLGRIEKLLGDA